MVDVPLGYLADHWHGRQGFAWSFWINLVALKLIILLGQIQFNPAEGMDHSAKRPLVIGLAILFHGLVFIWQVVGVLRASEAHVRLRGSMANAWGAQLGVLIAFWLTATYGSAPGNRHCPCRSKMTLPDACCGNTPASMT